MKKAAIFSAILHVAALIMIMMGIPNPFMDKPSEKHEVLISFERIGPKTAAPNVSQLEQENNSEKKTQQDRTETDHSEQHKQVKPSTSPTPETSTLSEQRAVDEKPVDHPTNATSGQDVNQQQTEQTIAEKAKKTANIKAKKKQNEAQALKKRPKKKEETKKSDRKKEKQTKNKKKDKKKKDNKRKNNKQKNGKDKNANKKAAVNLKQKKHKGVYDKKSKKNSLDDLFDEASKAEKSGAKSSSSGPKADEWSQHVTASEIAAIQAKIRKCWHVPAGAKGIDNMRVVLNLTLDNGGRIINAEPVDKARMRSDPFFRTAAESAIRASLDPECNPLPVPLKKIKELQKEGLEMEFNPSEMF